MIVALTGIAGMSVGVMLTMGITGMGVGAMMVSAANAFIGGGFGTHV